MKYEALSKSELEHFCSDGFLLIKDLYPPEKVALALKAAEILTYGDSFANFINTTSIKPSQIDQKLPLTRPKFPTSVDELDRLIEKDSLLDIFAQCLATEQIRFGNAHLFVRTGISDNKRKLKPWEGYHIDHDTDAFLPPHSNWQASAYLNCHIFLHDVDELCAPMQVVPGSHIDVANHLNNYFANGYMSDRGNIYDIQRLPETSSPISMTAPAGSVLIYSSYLIHAATPFKDIMQRRALFGVTMFRADAFNHRRVSWPYPFQERSVANAFIAKTTARFRSALGWPEPGHPYYTSSTLQLISQWYPGIDIDPYVNLTNGMD